MFEPFGKIARLSKEMVITEKLDGTNAQIFIDGDIFITGSRNKVITEQDDNHGFSRWANAHKEELKSVLGDGRHFGEWVGVGINGDPLKLKEKHFVLFNVGRWNDENKPKCCDVVPVLFTGMFNTDTIDDILCNLKIGGSVYAKKYHDLFVEPEGVVIFHKGSGTLFKKTIENDSGKSLIYS